MRHVLISCLMVVGACAADGDEVDSSSAGEAGETSGATDPGETGSSPTSNPSDPGESGDPTSDTSNDTQDDSDTQGDPTGASCDDAGQCTRIVFITDETFTGDLGGLAGADAKCQAEADAAGLPGTYRAWLSDDSTSAVDHVNLLANDDTFVRPDGRVIAADGATMVGGAALQNAIRLGADGVAVVAIGQQMSPCGSQTKGAAVWTGTAGDGSAKGASCNGWTDASSTVSGVGNFDERSHGRWTDTCGSAGCDSQARIYCVQQ